MTHQNLRLAWKVLEIVLSHLKLTGFWALWCVRDLKPLRVNRNRFRARQGQHCTQ